MSNGRSITYYNVRQDPIETSDEYYHEFDNKRRRVKETVRGVELATLNHTSNRLDTILEEYRTLIQSDQALDHTVRQNAEMRAVQQEQSNRDRALRLREEQKQVLDRQIVALSKQKRLHSQTDRAQDDAMMSMIKADDTLMAVYPRIKGVPDHVKM